MNKTREHFSFHKIRTQFILLLLFTGLFSFLLFSFLWYNRYPAFDRAAKINFLQLPIQTENFYTQIYEQAKKYSVPSDRKNEEEQKTFAPFYDFLDDYTGIHIYDFEKGIYRTGKFPRCLTKKKYFKYVSTQPVSLSLPFKNGVYTVIIYQYHDSVFMFFYFLFSLGLSIFVFIFMLSFFIDRKMKAVILLEQEIQRIASGDLHHPVSVKGLDEIGMLSKNLDCLRITLQDNIFQEQESRKANQDLIAALSHDLRTPLTILHGYLEVLLLKRNPQMQEDYLNRCLQKTRDIQELTDRMFEYALVSEEKETPEMTWLSTDFVEQCLHENCDYIQLAGFEVKLSLPPITGVFLGDRTMLKRIFNNLFSNILKYGDKKIPVVVSGKIDHRHFHLIIKNNIKQKFSSADSNNIGLKSARKMMKLLHGELEVTSNQNTFIILLKFSLK